MTEELAAIACATCFAFCSLAFAAAGRVVGSLVVNQLRILLAVVFLLGVHLAAHGSVWPIWMSAEQTWLLVLSGLVGLTVGDLFYFHAITVIGPRLGTLLMATAPIFVVVGEGFARQHWPNRWEFLWMTTIVAGVIVVVACRRQGDGWQAPAGRSRAFAFVAGMIGAIGQGVGMVLAKLAQDVASDPRPDALSVTLVRMVAGLVGIVGLVAVQRTGAGRAERPRMTRRAFWLIVTGVVFGPTLGVWLSMVAIEDGDAGPAAVLIGLTPVLMLPIGFLAWGHRPSLQAILGTVVAFGATGALIMSRAVE